jgi:GNAT superfamily N-acetyltransferase
MNELRLSIEENPDPGDVERLDDGIYAYNAEQTGRSDGRLLSVFLRDGEGRVVGGAFGNTWCGCLEVRLLWVEESLRRGGLGAQLLRAAEQEAIARGCHTAMLDTYEFQAPDFYRKLGYTVYAEIDDPQTQRKKIFLKRGLIPSSENS